MGTIASIARGLGRRAIAVLRARINRGGASPDARNAPDERPDATQDREDARVARMSEEDRAWENASLGRDRAARKRGGDAPGDPGGA